MKKISITNQVTEDCELACKYCYMWCDKRKNLGKVQDMDTLKNLLNKLTRDYDTIKFLWHGGEPLLPGLSYYKKVYEVEKYFIEKTGVKIENSMQTNGILLTEEYLDLLLDKLKMNIGISLDGDNIENDLARPMKNGESSFDKSIKALELIKSKTGCVNIFTVLTAFNASYPERYYSFLKKYKINSCKIFPYSDCKFRGDLKISNREFFEFHRKLFDMWYFDNNDIYISPVGEIVNYFKKKLCSAFSCENCLGDTLCIRVDGTINPCANLQQQEFILGNINKITSIEQVFSSENYKKLLLKKKINCEKCERECLFFPVCGGGCRAQSFYSTEDYGGEYPYCEGRANLIYYIGQNWKKKEEVVQTGKNIE